MKTEHGKIEGNLFLNYELVLHGMVTGDIVVDKGGLLYLHGVSGKDLIIQEGGKVYLYGTVSGDVHNLNGDLEVYGVINGHLRTDTGKTIIDKNAVVRK
jgi:cytoskeletal protein CcmA (bactofilin family)